MNGNLVSQILQAIKPEIAARIASALGLRPTDVQEALRIGRRHGGSSGLIGTGKELFATESSVMEGVKTYPGNELLKKLMPEAQGNPQQAMEQLKKFRDWGIARLKQKGIDSAEKIRALTIEDCKAVAALLAAKASPQEASEYRQWALSVAEKVANAASEGGFLGFGGERVSDAEKQLIAQIRSAFGDRPAA